MIYNLLKGLNLIRVTREYFFHNLLLEENIMAKEIQKGAPAGAVYGLGFIGAAIYFISHATSFWIGVLGILKAIVWPAIIVYEAFKHLA